ncbi:hypothetical protein [Sulfuricurvum sp.]|uniref:hypothetical protein n=1 Tax=Sulfuricurvum sp. TaxID=2025608 RepID=UPI003BB62B73
MLLFARIMSTALLVLFSMEVGAVEISLSGDTWSYGIVFKGGTKLTLDGSGQKPVRGTLASSYRSRDINWLAGTEISLNDKLEVMSGTVDAGQSAISVPLKPSTLLRFNQNGQVIYCTFASSINIDGLVFDPEPIIFYENGWIKSGTISKPFTFNAPGTGALFTASPGIVLFYPNNSSTTPLHFGAIQSAKLAMNHIDRAQTLPAGATIRLSASGAVIGIDSTSQFAYLGIALQGGGRIQVFENGQSSLQPYQAVQINGKTYPAFSFIFLSPEGGVVGVPPQ